MGWLTQFKKILNEEEKPQNNPIGKVSFEIVCKNIEDKLKELDSAEERLKEEIGFQISLFEKEIEPIVKKLEAFDISNRKENEKVKVIVEQNKKIYLSYLNNLLVNLKEIGHRDIKEYAGRVEQLINDFANLSRMPFEKTTLLIGKEAEAARISFKKFALNINSVLSSNRQLFEKKDAENSFRKILGEIKSYETLLKEFSLTLNELETKDKQTSEKKIKIIDEINVIAQSKEYQKDRETKQNNIMEKELIEREIQSVKEKIPWKELSRIYHHNEKKRELIKKYRENFVNALGEDIELEMNILLQEINLTDNAYFKELQIKIAKMRDPIVLPTDEKVSFLENKIKQLDLELANIIAEQENFQKKQNKMTVRKNELIKQATDISLLI